MMKKRMILFFLGIALLISMMFGIVPSALAHENGSDVLNDNDARIYTMLGEAPVYPDNTEEKIVIYQQNPDEEPTVLVKNIRIEKQKYVSAGSVGAAACVLMAAAILILMLTSRKSSTISQIVALLCLLASIALPVCYYTVHIWNPATCTAGETCRFCGKEKGEQLGHAWKEATCEASGSCSRCGKVRKPENGHKVQSATCTRSAFCTVCGKTFGEPVGHDWTEATEDAPKTCRVCDTTEGDRLPPEPKPLSEFVIEAHSGKVWIRSEEPCQVNHHTSADAPECWKDWSKPGYTRGTVRDNLGNEYKHGIHVDGWDKGDYYIEIRLDGKYTRFSGVCGCPERDAAIHNEVYEEKKDHTKYFEVYGDGHFLVRSATMRFDYAPEPFSIDVTGVQVLRILYPYGRSPNEVATIFDGMLS